MARKKSPTLTDAEHRIRKSSRQRGSASVADVADALEGKDGHRYTTILTMMRILHEKGYLTCRKSGRPHLHAEMLIAVPRRGKPVRQLLTKFFAGSPRANWCELSS
jgi:predicted transcriptional regulator